MSALSSAAAEPVFHFHFDRSATISEVAPHFLSHGPASFLGKRYERLPGRPATLLDRFEVGVKGRHREAMTFGGDLYILKARRLEE